MKKEFSVAFMPTQLPGITMYRFNNYTKYLKGVKIISPKFNLKGQKEMQEWEFFINDKGVLDDLNTVMNASDVLIFQRSLNPEPVILSIIDAVKEHNRQKPMQRKYVGMDIDDNLLNVPS